MRITITVEDDDGDILGKRTTESWEIAEMNFTSLQNLFR